MDGKRIKRIAVLVSAVFVSALALDVGRYFFYPDVSSLRIKNPRKTSFMEYREMEGRRPNQVWVPLSRVSPHLKRAVVIAEDGNFWSHGGFDLEAMEEAALENLKEKRFRRGGSTITQQLAKNLYLTPRKTPARKLKEAILTWRLERELSKQRILELYLNVAEWGDGVYGVEAAARRYYGKPAMELTPEEAARLAVVLPNPRRWSPTGGSRYVERRGRIIYGLMIKRGAVPAGYAETKGGVNVEMPPIEAVSAEEAPPEEEEAPTAEDAL